MIEVNLAEDVYPISEVQDSLRRIVEKASITGRPMVITQKGRPVAALIEIAEFERLRQLADLAEDYKGIIAGSDGPWHAHESVWQEIDDLLKQAGTGRDDAGTATGA